VCYKRVFFVARRRRKAEVDKDYVVDVAVADNDVLGFDVTMLLADRV